jgi:hypothetical protein
MTYINREQRQLAADRDELIGKCGQFVNGMSTLAGTIAVLMEAHARHVTALREIALMTETISHSHREVEIYRLAKDALDGTADMSWWPEVKPVTAEDITATLKQG